MQLGITYELNTRLKYTTLIPKRNDGFRGVCITQHTKVITLITITSHTPTQTVLRTAAIVSIFLRSLTKLFMQDFLEDVRTGRESLTLWTNSRPRLDNS
jgi:hypothetical protein